MSSTRDSIERVIPLRKGAGEFESCCVRVEPGLRIATQIEGYPDCRYIQPCSGDLGHMYLQPIQFIGSGCRTVCMLCGSECVGDPSIDILIVDTQQALKVGYCNVSLIDTIHGNRTP